MANARELVLVTGASGGIGEALAYCAAADGHDLILAARNETQLGRVEDAVAAKHKVKVTSLAADLGSAGGCNALAARLEGLGLIPGIVINNAGFGLIGAAASLSREEQLAMIDLNVRAVTDLSLRYLPGMIARGSGGIINLASVAGFMPGPNMAVYFATKAYVLSFSDALSEEVGRKGVTVMSLCPGPVETGFQARAGMKGLAEMRAGGKSAEFVAAEGWAGFKAGARVVIPGAANKFAAYATRGAPRRLILPLIRRAMGSARRQ